MQKEPISTSIKSQASEYKRENYSDECYVVHTRKKKDIELKTYSNCNEWPEYI